MNPVTNALRRVRESIPPEILEKTFNANIRSYDQYKPSLLVSIDKRIRERIIDSRVRVDCNLMGGQEITVPLDGLSPRMIDLFNFVYQIPKTLTQGKSITSVLSVSFGGMTLNGYSGLNPNYSAGTADNVMNVLNSAKPVPVVSTANAQLIEENTVLISDTIAVPRNLYLRCWVENDYEFTNIKPPSYECFARLVIFATKAYIYNNTLIAMDKAFIYAGGELGRYAEVVDSYSDADQNYQDELKRWRRVAMLNNHIAHRRMTRRLLGGGWV